MALSTSPRKVVPLATGDDWKPSRSNSSAPAFTKRVFFCGVVVEGSENGRRLPEDIQDLVLSLGDPLSSVSDTGILSSSSESVLGDRSETNRQMQRKRAMTDSSALADVISELVSTEQSYVRRLRTLKSDYADPLRKFSRSKDTAILPPYEAKTLFGNIDNLLPVNEAFLTDLEKMIAPSGAKTVGGVGDVALRHFKDLRGFEHYRQYYVKREDAQLIFEREMMKKSSGFAAFIDRIKYSSAETRNRVGLRELLMDPVQRIPRYTLLFRTMIKHMAPGDPQRAKLVEADEIASKIAHAETDEQTKRATILYCLNASVEGFPPELFSNSHRFIDCIDVEDMLLDMSLPSGSGPSSLHCTLFLFDDKLMIVKRPGNGEKGGRVLAGFDEVEKLTKSGGLPLGMKKSGMICKGVVDITDVVATDVGGADIHLYLENPPQDQNDRWAGRPFRSLSVVHPPAPVNLDPTQTESDKNRFLQNLWNLQATYRARAGQSVVLCAEDREVESKGGRVTVARTYFNVYQRTAFLQESKKTKIVVHIDSLGSADPIPFGVNAPPFVRVRIQPMAGELSRYTVTSSDPNDEGEEDIVQTARVPSRIVHTIHQFGLFKFRTGNNSLPSTPTASTRSRAAIFGLDAISRNLFNAGDFFGGSVNTHRRSKSAASRSSIYSQTTSTADSSLMRFSHRSNSTVTTATTMSTMDDESIATRSSSKSRNLLRRGKSPGGSDSEGDIASPRRRSSRPGAGSSLRSRSLSRERGINYADGDDDDVPPKMDESEWDLAMRLELARKNSQNQHGKQIVPVHMEKPMEETIYEEDPPQPVRPASRASRDSNSQRSTTPRPQSTTPTRALESPPYPATEKSADRRPLGPRSPSPLPPRSPHMSSAVAELPSMDDDLALETLPVKIPSTSSQPPNIASPLPRSKRQPFVPTGNMDATPKAVLSGTSAPGVTIEPLSIKKKTSVRTQVVGSPTPARKNYTRSSPMSRASAKIASPRRISPQMRNSRTMASLLHTSKNDGTEQLIQLAHTARENVESSRRAIKRIKLDIDELKSAVPQSGEDDKRPQSPDKGLRSPQKSNTPMTKAALERMEEMRQLIGKRQGEGTPLGRPRSMTVDALTPRWTDPVQTDSLVELVSTADRDLMRAAASHETLEDDLRRLAADFRERSTELEKARVELQNTRRQCELVKSLLTDATAEKEIMYEAFNEELDGMYNDANLPEEEAWVAMSQDLRRTKEDRNALTRENSQLKRRLAEIEMQQEEWGALLRAHGLIP